MSRRTWGIVAGVAVLLALGAGWYAWRVWNQAEPPVVDPTGVDPDVAAAIATARAGVLRAPRSASAWGELGKVLVAHQYEEEADFCFAQAERLDPKEARWPYFRGLAMTFHDSNATIAHFQRAVQLAKRDENMRLRLAEALQAQNRLDEAEEQFRELLGYEPPHPRALLGMARLRFQRGDLDAARTYLDRAANAPLTRKAAGLLRAEIDQRAGATALATKEQAAAAALPDDPDWTDPYLDEILRLKAGRDDRLEYGLNLLKQGRLPEAGDRFRELVERYPDWGEGWLTYGRFWLESGNYPAAEQALRSAVKAAPQSATAQFYLGVTLVRRNDYLGAETCFREAVRIKHDYALAYFNLGQCLKHDKQRPEAIAMFREAVRCKPDYTAAHVNLGELLAEENQKGEALDHVRLALAVNPEDVEAKKLLERLEQR